MYSGDCDDCDNNKALGGLYLPFGFKIQISDPLHALYFGNLIFFKEN